MNPSMTPAYSWLGSPSQPTTRRLWKSSCATVLSEASKARRYGTVFLRACGFRRGGCFQWHTVGLTSNSLILTFGESEQSQVPFTTLRLTLTPVLIFTGIKIPRSWCPLPYDMAQNPFTVGEGSALAGKIWSYIPSHHHLPLLWRGTQDFQSRQGKNFQKH